jgi:hypothetical protein
MAEAHGDPLQFKSPSFKRGRAHGDFWRGGFFARLLQTERSPSASGELIQKTTLLAIDIAEGLSRIAKKARRAIAAQILWDCGITTQLHHDTVPRPRIIGKSVQENSRALVR